MAHPSPHHRAAPSDLPPDVVRHEEWVESGGERGACARLSGRDLRGLDLTFARLDHADLSCTDLRGTRLSGASLADASLHGANLTNADLRHTSLRNADLSDAIGLLDGQLAGADLANATLPAVVSRFAGIQAVGEASAGVMALLVTMIVAALYLLLTAFSTPDSALLLNKTQSPLPIIQTPVPMRTFLVIGPVLLAGLFGYVCLLMLRLAERLSALPVVLPDGRPLPDTLNSMLIDCLVRRYSPRLRRESMPRDRLQFAAFVVIVWLALPATLLSVWFVCLRVHDISVTVAQTLLVVVATVASVVTHANCKATLTVVPRRCRSSRVVIATAIAAASLGGLSVALWLDDPCADGAEPGRGKAFASALLLGARMHAVISDEELSTKPSEWPGDSDALDPKTSKSLTAVRGARFSRDLDFRRGKAVGTFLANADLSRANLAGAEFNRADLRSADLHGACICNSTLGGALLQGANLSGTNLRNADFGDADLRGANLAKTDLTAANLATVKNLTPETIKQAHITEQTQLPPGLSISVQAPAESLPDVCGIRPRPGGRRPY